MCGTEPLWQTDFLFVALSHCDKQSLYMYRKINPKRAQKCYIFGTFFAFFGTFVTFWHFVYPFSVFSHKILHTLAFFVQYIPILFVAVTQCDKQKIHLSQWLSATNKTNLFHSDSVRQTTLKKTSKLFVACDKRNGKNQNKHTFKFEFHHRDQISLGYLIFLF